MFPSRHNFALYASVLAVLIGLGLWLRTDLLNGRNAIIRDQSALAVQKSRFLGQALSTDLVSMQFVLEGLYEQIGASDLVYPNTDIARQQQIAELLAAKANALPKPSTRNLALFNSDCVYTAATTMNVVGERSNNTLCRTREATPGQLHIEYMPRTKSLSHEPVLLLIYPFITPDNKMAGGATAVVSLLSAHDAVTARFAAHPGEFIALVDENETILAHSNKNPAMIGKPFDDFYAHDPEASVNAPHEALVSDGQRALIVGMTKVPNTTLAMVVGFDRETVLEEWQRRAGQLVAGYIGIAILLLLVVRAYARMRLQRDEMTRLATTDVLTGTANRRQFMQVMKQEYRDARRNGRLMSVLMIDIDRFKAINDTFGHATGDQVIVSLAEVLSSNVRPVDMVARIGGEEFAVLLPGLNTDHAETVAERLRAEAEALEVTVAEHEVSLRFSISVGVATLRSSDSDSGDMLQRADKALYGAKDGGRNRVMVAAAPPMQPGLGDGLVTQALRLPTAL